MLFTNWGSAISETVKKHPISITQGLKKGPKLFNVIINELPKITNLFSVLYPLILIFFVLMKIQ